MLPTIDISNPTSITAGNIYLKPNFSHYYSANVSYNDKKSFAFVSADIYGNFYQHPVVTASWFDADGIRYSVPVNSQKSGNSISLYMNYNQPLGKHKYFTIYLNCAPSYTRTVSYQSQGILDPIDTKNFDYAEFMSKFWGDENGSNFYSGKSGFKQSKTDNVTIYAGVGLIFKKGGLSTRIGYNPGYNFSRYSLDSKANVNTYDHTFYYDFEYTTTHNWEFQTDFRYSFYRGYTSGFETPDYKWDLGISKDIKAVTLSLFVYDVLNSTKYRDHRVTENYSQDRYGLVMGRYITFGVKVNFGKMNQANAGKAQNASWKMSY